MASLKKFFHYRPIIFYPILTLFIIVTSLGIYSLIKNTRTISAAWYDSGWGYRKKLTFDYTKVSGSSNLAYFPILINRTDTDWKTTGYGGHVGQTDGGDFVFTSSNGTTILDHDIEKYDPATGELIVWVEIPSLSYTADTEIYIYYGNAACANQWDTTGTWDENGTQNFATVLHLGETPANGGYHFDSSARGLGGTFVDADGDSVTNYTGQIDGADDLNGDADHITLPDSSYFTPTNLTFTGWVNQDSLSTAKTIVAKWGSGTQGSWALQTDATTNTKLQLFIANALDDGGDNFCRTPTDSWSTGWHHVSFVYYGAGVGNTGKTQIYIDGVNQVLTCSGTIGSSFPDNTSGVHLGRFQWVGRYWDGKLDEFRLAATNRTAGWITTEFNNQSAPNTFLKTTAGEETSNSAPSVPTLIYPTNSATGIGITPPLRLLSTDSDSDTLQYRIFLATNSSFTGTTQTFDLSSSSVGWSGINVGTSAYSSGTTSAYIIQSPLSYSTLYYWKGQTIDPSGTNSWTALSAGSSFTTSANQTPNSPANINPGVGLTGVSINPTLSSTSFSDPDYGDTHSYSQWQIATDSGFSGTIVWDSSDASTNLTSIIVNNTNGTFSGILAGQTSLALSTQYYFRVRHQDNHTNWSGYSTPTDFTTGASAQTDALFLNGLNIEGINFN